MLTSNIKILQVFAGTKRSVNVYFLKVVFNKPINVDFLRKMFERCFKNEFLRGFFEKDF